MVATPSACLQNATYFHRQHKAQKRRINENNLGENKKLDAKMANTQHSVD